ncbi:hypothetical protein [Zobellia nedashkovskayae]|uniref:hypothetical protein n=1 Tax=Zobellia nedashkovskayae TaxID=2779510 RepID=UPI00188A9AFB|nr:hypothetical protein [Zobellia nedashkovskayae]
MFQLSRKTGYKSAFYSSPFFNLEDDLKYCGGFNDEFKQGNIDFGKLVHDLPEIFKGNMPFNQRFYLKYSKIHRSSPIKTAQNASALTNTPFEYVFENNRLNGEFDSAYLNSRICGLDDNIGYSIIIDSSKRKFKFGIYIYYSNTEELRRKKPALETEEENDFYVDDKYKAIKLFTSDPILFLGFFDTILPIKSKLSKRKGKLINEFENSFKSTSTISDLNWLYENTPLYFLKHRSINDLWNSFVLLYIYDTIPIGNSAQNVFYDNKFYDFLDSSIAMVKIFSAIVEKDGGSNFLFGKLKDSPELIKKIYNNLDKSSSSSFHNNQEVKNKTIFASLINTICLFNKNELLKKEGDEKEKKHDKRSIKFYVNSTHTVDCNILSSDTVDGKINLTQKWSIKTQTGTKQKNYGDNIMPDYHAVPVYETEKGQSSTLYLHPLDIVSLVLKDENGEPYTIAVPAIFVKDIAFHSEWADVMEIVNIGLDIIAIAIGVLSLGTASPFAVAFIMLDVGLASTDLMVIASKKQLEQSEEGREFLQIWNQIQTYGSIITLTPDVKSVLGKGAKIIGKSVNLLELKNVYNQCVLKVLLEIELLSFARIGDKNVLNIISSPTQELKFIKNQGKVFERINLHKYQEAGAVLVEGKLKIIKGEKVRIGNGIALIHEGEVVVQGSPRKVEKVLKQFNKITNANKLEEALAGFIRSNNLKTILKYDRKVENLEFSYRNSGSRKLQSEFRNVGFLEFNNVNRNNIIPRGYRGVFEMEHVIPLQIPKKFHTDYGYIIDFLNEIKFKPWITHNSLPLPSEEFLELPNYVKNNDLGYFKRAAIHGRPTDQYYKYIFEELTPISDALDNGRISKVNALEGVENVINNIKKELIKGNRSILTPGGGDRVLNKYHPFK